MSAKPSIMTRQTRIGEPKGWDFPADMCELKKDVPRYYEKGDGSGGLLTRWGQERRDGRRRLRLRLRRRRISEE